VHSLPNVLDIASQMCYTVLGVGALLTLEGAGARSAQAPTEETPMKTSQYATVANPDVRLTEVRFKLTNTFQAFLAGDDELIIALPTTPLDMDKLEALFPDTMDKALKFATMEQVADLIYNTTIASVIAANRVRD
jgi:hypothetical protein